MYKQAELIEKVNHYISNIQYNKTENLYSPIKYTLDMGGKRIRPILMLMAYNLYKEDVDSILNCAIAMETYHNFTLLHDDLMDNADMRRNNLTVHKKWNANTAILSGDAMLILAYKLFTQNNGNIDIHNALISFNEATLGVCEGQQYDMDFETRNDVKEEEYIEMIRLKTSLLLGYSLKIGAQLASANDRDAEQLYNFGEKIGLAFQLQDDFLDVYGDPKIFGKKIGGDILCNKKTFMLIKALEEANENQKRELNNWLAKKEFNPEEKIHAVTKIYDEIDIKSICKAKIEELFKEAICNLDNISVAEENKKYLREFALNLLDRKN